MICEMLVNDMSSGEKKAFYILYIRNDIFVYKKDIPPKIGEQLIMEQNIGNKWFRRFYFFTVMPGSNKTAEWPCIFKFVCS